MKENETKRDSFVRLAEYRMNNVLKGIALLGNLSNTNNYEYTQEDVNKMLKTLKSAINELERKYNTTTKNKKW